MNQRLLSYITVFALVALFSFWQTGSNDFAYILIFYLLSFAILIIGYATAINAVNAYRTMRFQQNPATIIVTDVSNQGIQLPEPARPLHQKLLTAGFERIGELEVHMPYFPAGYNYQYKLDDGELSATIVGAENHFYIRLFSKFDDGALLETYHPIGFDIESPILRSRMVKDDFEHALAFHQYQMGVFGQVHGKPGKHPDMDSLNIGDEARLMEFTLIRNQHILKRLQRATFVTSMALVILIPTWFHMRALQRLDMSTVLGMIAAVAVAVLLMGYLTQKENELYADKRKFQKNQA